MKILWWNVVLLVVFIEMSMNILFIGLFLDNWVIFWAGVAMILLPISDMMADGHIFPECVEFQSPLGRTEP